MNEGRLMEGAFPESLTDPLAATSYERWVLAQASANATTGGALSQRRGC